MLRLEDAEDGGLMTHEENSREARATYFVVILRQPRKAERRRPMSDKLCGDTSELRTWQAAA